MSGINLSIGQIQQVAALSIALGTALAIGEVRIQKLEIHKETYEKIASSAKEKAIQNEKGLAVTDAKIESYIKQQRQMALKNSELRW
tara:strand:+ start:787 stop:1047 length:261 start_codon:yes stop_codon:yes gene_type:complete